MEALLAVLDLLLLPMELVPTPLLNLANVLLWLGGASAGLLGVSAVVTGLMVLACGCVVSMGYRAAKQSAFIVLCACTQLVWTTTRRAAGACVAALSGLLLSPIALLLLAVMLAATAVATVTVIAVNALGWVCSQLLASMRRVRGGIVAAFAGRRAASSSSQYPTAQHQQRRPTVKDISVARLAAIKKWQQVNPDELQSTVSSDWSLLAWSS